MSNYESTKSLGEIRALILDESFEHWSGERMVSVEDVMGVLLTYNPFSQECGCGCVD